MGRMRIPPRKIPDNVNPTGWRCIQLMIPDDDEWEHIAYSTLYDQLALVWFNWQRTGDNTGSKLCQIWRAALKTWTHCVQCPSAPSIGADSEDFMIRQNPDNPCQLQSSVDGSTWCTFADFSMCVAGSLQENLQPGPQPQPDPGGCSSFDVTLNGNNQYLLPVSCGGGDTVTITRLTGGWNDGGAPNWYCPDAHYYEFGFCGSGGQHTVGGDPAASLFHMQLIAYDGTNYYDAASGSFTITSGIPDGTRLVFQANDSDITNNAGSVSFHVQICKNTHPATFYYALYTNTYNESGHATPANIQWFPLSLGTPHTITSLVPDDVVNPPNASAYVAFSFAADFNPTTGFAQNPAHVCFKVTSFSISGQTPVGPYYAGIADATVCTALNNYHDSTTNPAGGSNYEFVAPRSTTQFVVNIQIDPCS